MQKKTRASEKRKQARALWSTTSKIQEHAKRPKTLMSLFT